MKKRILIFSTSYFPHIGGAEVAIKEITDRLPGYEFEMITARLKKEWPKKERVNNITVHRLGRGSQFCKFSLPFLGARKARALNRQNKFDMAWCMLASHASIAAGFFRKRSGIPLLLTLQEGDGERHLVRYTLGNEFLYRLLVRPWHLLVFKHADRIQVISEYLRQRALRYKFTRPIDIVPNGVEVERFVRVDQRDTERIKKKFNKQANDVWLITTGRLENKNGVEFIIRALFSLEKNIKFLSVGDGRDLEKLIQIAKELGVEDRIFFEKKVDNKEIPAYLKAADIFVRPSLSEGQGISFLEAMAAGVPVITTPVGGIVDFLFDSKKNPDKAPTGIFCQPRDPDSIVKALNRYLDNSALREKIIDNAKTMVKEKYQWEGIVKRIKEIFIKTINTSPPAPLLEQERGDKII